MESKLQNNHNFQLEEDQNLWRALKHSDPVALNKLFTKYYENLYFYGLKITPSHDVVVDTIQDVFVKIWESRYKISKVKFVKAYLFASFRNNLIKINNCDILKRADTNNYPDKDYCFEISPEEIFLNNESHNEAMKIIEYLLSNLTPKQRDIIYLKFYCNHSNIEIGHVLSINQQSVANLLTRTLKILRKLQKQSSLNIF